MLLFLSSSYKTLTKGKHSWNPQLLYRAARQYLENGIARQPIRSLSRSVTLITNEKAHCIKTRYLYFVFSTSKQTRLYRWCFDRCVKRAKASARGTMRRHAWEMYEPFKTSPRCWCNNVRSAICDIHEFKIWWCCISKGNANLQCNGIKSTMLWYALLISSK